MKYHPPEKTLILAEKSAERFIHLAKCVENRCRMLGEEPSIMHIPTQIALRSTILMRASFRTELASARGVVAWFLENEGWPDRVDDRGWIRNVALEEVGLLHANLAHPTGDFIDLGTEIFGEMIDRAMMMGHPGPDEDTAFALGGISSGYKRFKQPNWKSMEPLTDHDFMEIERHLSDHPRSAAFRTLGTKRVNINALLGIFMRAIRLTGMRPGEVFNCRLFVGDESKEYSAEDILGIHDNPHRAVLDDQLTPIDILDPKPWGSFAAMIEHFVGATGVPPILAIVNLKTARANPVLLRSFRTQILADIDGDNIEVLCLAALLHCFPIDKKRRTGLINEMTARLANIAKVALPRLKARMNLYALRHDFATRARRRFHMWEVAALMGHTGRDSPNAYGKRHTRRRRGSGSGGGWMPRYDPELAAEIRENWKARTGPSLGSDARAPRKDAERHGAPPTPAQPETW